VFQLSNPRLQRVKRFAGCQMAMIAPMRRRNRSAQQSARFGTGLVNQFVSIMPEKLVHLIGMCGSYRNHNCCADALCSSASEVELLAMLRGGQNKGEPASGSV